MTALGYSSFQDARLQPPDPDTRASDWVANLRDTSDFALAMGYPADEDGDSFLADLRDLYEWTTDQLGRVPEPHDCAPTISKQHADEMNEIVRMERAA